jgi:hypothetical protein
LTLAASIVNTGAVIDIAGASQFVGPDQGAVAQDPHVDIGWSFNDVTMGSAVVGSSTLIQNDPGTTTLGLGYRFPPVASGVYTFENLPSDCEGKIMYLGEITPEGTGDYVILGGTKDFFGARGTITVGSFADGFPTEIEFA